MYNISLFYTIEGDGELFGRDRDSVVGRRAETVSSRGRHLGEEDFLAFLVSRIARTLQNF